MKHIIITLLLLTSIEAFAGRDCYAPWGGVVRDGFDVMAYKEQRPTGGARCEYEYRRCRDGYLSGWYQYSSCQEDYSCYTPEFGYMSHYQSVTAYMNSAEYGGARCQSENRLCQYGQLTGSYRHRYCTEYP